MSLFVQTGAPSRANAALGRACLFASLCATACGALACATAGNDSGPMPSESAVINRLLPDLTLRTTDGQARSLSSLWSEKPLMLTPIFSRCAHLCSPFLGSLKAAAADADGRDYRIVVLSFDPRDTPADLAVMARSLELDSHPAWVFACASEEDLDRLLPALGFWKRWDERTAQFDHPAMIAAIDKGRCARLLVGGEVAPARFKEMVAELRGEFVPMYPQPGNVLFRCFDYDPASGFRPNWGLLIVVLPGMLAVLAAACVFCLGRTHRDHRRLPSSQSGLSLPA